MPLPVVGPAAYIASVEAAVAFSSVYRATGRIVSSTSLPRHESRDSSLASPVLRLVSVALRLVPGDARLMHKGPGQ